MYLACPDESFLSHPCLVESLGAPIPNVKDQVPVSPVDRPRNVAAQVLGRMPGGWGAEPRRPSVCSFDEIMSRAAEHVAQLQEDFVQEEGEDESSAAVAVMEGNPRRLCTESQLTFVVPPTMPPFHVRFRLEVQGRKEAWQNPLTWSDGFFFSPRLRAPVGNACMPPPVLLSPDWEKANIEGKWAWQEQIKQPQEGELRLFTLAGLLPSVETSGISGWFVGKAGQGLYGTRYVELQFADAREDAWEEVQDWSLLEPLRYRLPSVDVGTAALTLALNWGRCIGVQKMQETLVSELGRKNRKANLRMIHDFALDTYEKLVPVWHSSVEPWLAQNPTLAILVAERRSTMIRRRVVEFLQTLEHRGLIQGIPPALIPLRPTLLSLKCVVQGTAVDTTTWVEVPEGQGLTLTAEAIPTNATGSTASELTLWWLVPQANEPGLDMAALVGQNHDMLPGLGGKLRLPLPVVNKDFTRQSSGDDDIRQDVASSVLHLPGRNRWGNPMVEAGTEFMVRVVAEEPRAHEDAFKDVRIRVVQQGSVPLPQRVSQRQLASPELRPQEVEDCYRRTPPRVWGFIKPAEQVAVEFKARLEQNESVAEAAEAVLGEIGFTPTRADIADVIAAVGESETAADRSELFRCWYGESVFGRSLLAEGWLQAKNTLRERRNKFLEETLEIPRGRWGFNGDEWGGVIPEMGLMRLHLSCLTKRHLAATWNSRDEIREKKDASESNKDPVAPEQPAPSSVRLDVPECVDEATMLAVAEALTGGMAKQYMSKLLPAGFGEEARKEWVNDSAADRSMQASAEQLLTYRFAEYYAYTLSKETAKSRNVREAAAAAREAAATAWLEDWRKNGMKAGNPPENVYPSEAAKVVLKTAIKQEVARFMELQMVPLVQTHLREHLVPACVQTVKSMAWEFVAKRWLGLGLGGFTIGTVVTGIVLGPWVAVFVLFRRQRPL